MEPRQPLLHAVIDSAAAVLRDPRFVAQPVTLQELRQLEIEVTILSALAAARGPLDFSPEVHGIHLTIGGKSACFLPQVARDTGWPREKLLDRLCSEKLGLPADSWRDAAAILATFTTEIIGPEPFDDDVSP